MKGRMLAAALAVVLSTVAQAEQYVAVGGFMADPQDAGFDNGGGGAAAFGFWNVANNEPNVGFEAELRYRHSENGEWRTAKRLSAGFNFLWKFTRVQDLWSPYLLLGPTYVHSEVRGWDDSDYGAQLGIGMLYQLNPAWNVRAEFTRLTLLDSDAYDEHMAMLGLQYSLGK